MTQIDANTFIEFKKLTGGNSAAFLLTIAEFSIRLSGHHLDLS